MITAVSLNPSIDRTISVKQFTYGGMNRVASLRNDAGGKAVNVAIVAASLGVQSECVGFLYRDNGRPFESKLLRSGVQSEFIWLDGRVRTNIKLLDQSNNVVTEINEPGMPVGPDALEDLLELICAHAENSDFLVLTGSLPPGCPSYYYKQAIEAVEGLNCRCVLDAEGETLAQGIGAHPFLIKPNLHELEMVVGHPLNGVPDVARAAREFIPKGVEIVAVSLGAEGALIADTETTLYAPRVPVEVRSTVGAGDSMVAGLVAGFLAEQPLKEAFRMGVACATASIMTEGTQLVERASYKELLGKVEIEEVDV